MWLSLSEKLFLWYNSLSIKPLERVLNCSWKLPFAERWRNILILCSEQYRTIEWQEDLQENPEMPPRSLYPLTGTIWVRSLSNWWNYSSEAFSPSGGVRDSHSTFCSNIGNPCLLGFCVIEDHEGDVGSNNCAFNWSCNYKQYDYNNPSMQSQEACTKVAW